MCNCRISRANRYKFQHKFMPFTLGPHDITKCNFTCPLCLHSKRKFSNHTTSYQYGDPKLPRIFECDYCHNYIRQYHYHLQSINVECFFVLDYCVFMFQDKVILGKPGFEDIELPFFIFENESQLIKKVNTYITLS